MKKLLIILLLPIQLLAQQTLDDIKDHIDHIRVYGELNYENLTENGFVPQGHAWMLEKDGVSYLVGWNKHYSPNNTETIAVVYASSSYQQYLYILNEIQGEMMYRNTFNKQRMGILHTMYGFRSYDFYEGSTFLAAFTTEIGSFDAVGLYITIDGGLNMKPVVDNYYKGINNP